MEKNKVILLIGFIFFSFNKDNNKFKNFEILKVSEPYVIINYSNHIIVLNKSLKMPVYEMHLNKKNELLKRNDFKRPSFKQDDRFIQWTYKTSYYTSTGFDRGHLYSAESASISKKSYDECFLTTNVIPQNPSLNRGQWKVLEDLARDKAIELGQTKEINLVYNFEKKEKIYIPKYITKIIINPNKEFQYFTFDNIKNQEVFIPLDSIYLLWNKNEKIILK